MRSEVASCTEEVQRSKLQNVIGLDGQMLTEARAHSDALPRSKGCLAEVRLKLPEVEATWRSPGYGIGKRQKKTSDEAPPGQSTGKKQQHDEGLRK